MYDDDEKSTPPSTAGMTRCTNEYASAYTAMPLAARPASRTTLCAVTSEKRDRTVAPTKDSSAVCVLRMSDVPKGARM